MRRARCRRRRRSHGGAGSRRRGPGEVRRRRRRGDPSQPGGLSQGAGGAVSPRVVLVGPPGSGKTTVGESLAAKLGVSFRDTDQDVEARAGRTISDLFVEEGEPYFRA